MESFFSPFSQTGFMPHLHCYLARPLIVWTMFGTDLMIGVAYVCISITLWALVKKIKLPFNLVVFCFGIFIAACGATHFMEVWTLWHPDYWWSALVKLITAIASVGTGIYLFQLRHSIVTVAEAAKLSEQRRRDLETLAQDLEKRVSERTEHLQLALDATKLGIWEYDVSKGTLVWDDRTEQIFGLEPKTFGGTYQDFTSRLHPEDRARVMKTLSQAIQTQTDYRSEYRVMLPNDSTRWIVARGRLLSVGKGKTQRMIGSALDITERKNVEIGLEKAVRARDEFLSIASHELRTPITSMKMQTQMLKRGAAKNDPSLFTREKMEKLLDQSDRQLDRLTHLIEDMLDISRISAGKLLINPERVELCELAREITDRHRPQLEAARCSVSISCDAPVSGHWDRMRIEQVLTNLLTNALRYGAGKAISIRVGREGSHAFFMIRDQGIGIAQENHRRIFQRFERAVSANEVSGLGLGLYIVQQIVEMHRGSITVESELGQGATFKVTLPSAD